MIYLTEKQIRKINALMLPGVGIKTTTGKKTVVYGDNMEFCAHITPFVMLQVTSLHQNEPVVTVYLDETHPLYGGVPGRKSHPETYTMYGHVLRAIKAIEREASLVGLKVE